MPAVTVSNVATLIVPDNTQRLNLILRNNSSVVCYLGQDNTVTPSNGVQLNQNDTLNEDNSGTRGYRGPIWGITSSSTATIVYWERNQ